MLIIEKISFSLTGNLKHGTGGNKCFVRIEGAFTDHMVIRSTPWDFKEKKKVN